MGRPFYEWLGDGHVYSCRLCHVPISKKDELLSKAFHARSGKAYLFHHAANVCLGPKEERMMTTGMHVVSDIFCVSCCNPLGWRYDMAYEKQQKYKEGKYILERAAVLRVCHGDDDSSLPCDSESEDY
mmetsp:Transcript_12551/g.27074  ORF Transcript_12551/g.27074 Transcript_12551/m.27074 type:complete len:128 (+) Transcript_12551:215-598(+)|eukprot:CAMPEP_0202890514 /NCGR_PEP_ID=MMETSP1392-20130828/890_1 /ASSEMBLY_ACC=CAM_ASM_000868 /TAXON_ID=225041 /ORGANISM="Chlamydomonas chlamydogama, Strain SAG 11-48b" /LENGTH=127 /DNA_ID=CAMNT_0049574095 /DNA_START=99 /DNA_END=482 /DNA_ORIENTATION=-